MGLSFYKSMLPVWDSKCRLPLVADKKGCEASLRNTKSFLEQNKEARFELQKSLGDLELQHKELKEEHDEVSFR